MTFIHKNKKYKLEEPDKSLSFEVSGDVKCKAKKDNEFYLDYQQRSYVLLSRWFLFKKEI